MRVKLEHTPRDSDTDLLSISIVTLLGLISSVVVAVGWLV